MYHPPQYRLSINVQPSKFDSSLKSLFLEKCVSLLSLIGQSNRTVKRAEGVDFNRRLYHRQ